MRYLALLLLLTSCAVRKGIPDSKLRLQIVQINDVYEIEPLEGGKVGGIGRVGFLKKQVASKGDPTIMVMAGDFLSPSVYNSLRYNGVPIRGKQMVETLNAAGLDLAMFGNHEFDIRENELQSRLDESEFEWISTNAFQKRGDTVRPFKVRGNPVPRNRIKEFRDKDGTVARVGFVTATLPFNRAAYVSYTDAVSSAKAEAAAIKDSVHCVIGFTHLQMPDDRVLAREVPYLSAIIGGHEHDRRFETEGAVNISKAHANARSAYVITLDIDTEKKTCKTKYDLVHLDNSISFDPAVSKVVDHWTAIAEKSLDSLGFDAKAVVLKQEFGLDGRETEVRSTQTNLTRYIVGAMRDAAPIANVVLFNGGSIRVDDIVKAPVTQYDIVRILPFGGGIREVEMKGELLLRILDIGIKNKGTGGFLHSNTEKVDGKWRVVGGQDIEPQKNYRVALTEFLLTGGETGLSFLKENAEGITKVYPVQREGLQSDIRIALIQYMLLVK